MEIAKAADAPRRSGAQDAAGPPALARLLSLLVPTALALYANFQGVQQILIPSQVEAIDPAGKIANLALLTMLCSITGILGLTVGGAASDAMLQAKLDELAWLYATTTSDALPTVPNDWRADHPTPSNLATPYGTLWQVVHESVDPSRSDSLVSDMNHIATLLGFPELASP